MSDTKITPVYHIPKVKQHAFSRIGIYARVSTRSAAQLHSMAAQVSELTRFVAARPDWQLVDVYMDFESASGSKTREEYARMIDDAANHKLDIIITKSVQRFGRNTEETLITMRSLLESGVIIYFQIEGYSSNMPEAELQTSLRTALASADNASRREERLWGVQRRIEDGTSELYKRPCYGYKKNKDGILMIDPERAQIVKDIYAWYLSGMSISGIKRELESKQILSPSGKPSWPVRTIDMMLSNEKYTGKILLFKTVMINYPYSVRVQNSNAAVKEQYCMSNGVDEIIDKETFAAVQEEKNRRSTYEVTEDGKKRKSKKYSSKHTEHQSGS
ncbi:MAG: recombinase family protein [Clostridiaceae bacterium]|jgi:DNA invertase Pin-like site-specific DNA recombinase|nr:recombinase family protein [Clostridiaceae bacterium]